jgi:hypothetical protein
MTAKAPPIAYRSGRLKGRSMTVCLGALAANAMAIVCVADKCITYSQDI